MIQKLDSFPSKPLRQHANHDEARHDDNADAAHEPGPTRALKESQRAIDDHANEQKLDEDDPRVVGFGAQLAEVVHQQARVSIGITGNVDLCKQLVPQSLGPCGTDYSGPLQRNKEISAKARREQGIGAVGPIRDSARSTNPSRPIGRRASAQRHPSIESQMIVP